MTFDEFIRHTSRAVFRPPPPASAAADRRRDGWREVRRVTARARANGVWRIRWVYAVCACPGLKPPGWQRKPADGVWRITVVHVPVRRLVLVIL